MRTMIAAAALLAGCQTCPPAPPARVVDTGCSWVIPMTASTADTPETKREILAYELARRANCPK
ncbi:hypothetical protein BLA18628_07220 [Burkholderia aenigmatica]|uniref:hypothetical protein n=1 Tax=Burkholderia aenigmatica TaxID=2015348 RepID=UPI00145475F7|nr:hypothetical protein [Burkholderia aenigmatica]VWD61027.1 hypothetical protein BLA18628_07220 [Burkholderia aenigmatica]